MRKESTYKHKDSNYEAAFRRWMNKLETELIRIISARKATKSETTFYNVQK